MVIFIVLLLTMSPCWHNNFDTTFIHDIVLINDNNASNDDATTSHYSSLPMINLEFVVFWSGNQADDGSKNDGDSAIDFVDDNNTWEVKIMSNAKSVSMWHKKT